MTELWHDNGAKSAHLRGAQAVSVTRWRAACAWIGVGDGVVQRIGRGIPGFEVCLGAGGAEYLDEDVVIEDEGRARSEDRDQAEKRVLHKFNPTDFGCRYRRLRWAGLDAANSVVGKVRHDKAVVEHVQGNPNGRIELGRGGVAIEQ